MHLLPVALLLACIPLASCADQLLSDDRAIGSISGSLGIPASEVRVVGRRADGPTNTNFIVETEKNGRYVCTINGGNVMTFGMTNGAACRRPGAV